MAKSIPSPAKTTEESSQLFQQLSDMFIKLFSSELEEVIAKKKKEYSRKSPPKPDDVKRFIAVTTSMNAGMVTGLNLLIPGPLGMLTVLPEYAIMERNNMHMVCDIAAAHDKLDDLRIEHVLASYIGDYKQGKQAMGKIMLPLLTQNTSITLIKKLATNVGVRLTKKSVIRFVPVAGAALLGAWATYTTIQLGRQASELFADEIELIEMNESEIPAIFSIPTIPDETTKPELIRTKLLLLNNLMLIDSNVHPKEMEFITRWVQDFALSDQEKKDLIKLISMDKTHEVDITPLKDNIFETESLFWLLSALAQKDGTIRMREVEYLSNLAREFNFPETKVRAYLYSTMQNT